VVIGVHLLVSRVVPLNSVSKLHVQVEPSETRVARPPQDDGAGAVVEVVVAPGSAGGRPAPGEDGAGVEVVVGLGAVGIGSGAEVLAVVVLAVVVVVVVVVVARGCGVLRSPVV